MRRVRAPLVCTLAFIALSLSEAAVHVYNYETFDSISDAKVFKGGHEGMFRTRDHAEGSVVTPKRQGTPTLLPLASACPSQLHVIYNIYMDCYDFSSVLCLRAAQASGSCFCRHKRWEIVRKDGRSILQALQRRI